MDLYRLSRLAANRYLQRGLATLSARTGRLWHRPVHVSFEITTVCNLKCRHCPVWRGRRDPQALSQAEWLETLRALRRWSGPFSLGFTSGEPFLAPAFFPILREAAALGVQTSCVTHGGLIDEKVAREIMESRLGLLILSLDGMRDHTHDFSRGVSGARVKAIAGLRRLQALPRRPVLKINTVIAGHNLDELGDLAQWTADEGLEGISFLPLRQRGEDWRSLWPADLAKVSATIDRLIAARRRGLPILNTEHQLEAMKLYYADPATEHPSFDCETASQLHVGNDGTVRFCVAKPPVGNVRRQSLEELWASRPAGERFAEILGCKKSCILINCNSRAGLRSRAGEFARQVDVV